MASCVRSPESFAGRGVSSQPTFARIAVKDHDPSQIKQTLFVIFADFRFVTFEQRKRDLKALVVEMFLDRAIAS